jgi:hypothetical protein
VTTHGFCCVEIYSMFFQRQKVAIREKVEQKYLARKIVS